MHGDLSQPYSMSLVTRLACAGVILGLFTAAYGNSTAQSGGVEVKYEKWCKIVSEILVQVPIVTVGSGETFDLLVRDRQETKELLHSDEHDLLALLAGELSEPTRAADMPLLPELICTAIGVGYSDAVNHANQIASEVKGADLFDFQFGENWLAPTEVRRLMAYLIQCHTAGRPVVSYLRELCVKHIEAPFRLSHAQITLGDNVHFRSVSLWGRHADIQEVPDPD
jgi:hypothetical protein